MTCLLLILATLAASITCDFSKYCRRSFPEDHTRLLPVDNCNNGASPDHIKLPQRFKGTTRQTPYKMVGAGPLSYWRICSFLILCGTDFGTQHSIGFYFNRRLPFFGTYFAKARQSRYGVDPSFFKGSSSQTTRC